MRRRNIKEASEKPGDTWERLATELISRSMQVYCICFKRTEDPTKDKVSSNCGDSKCLFLNAKISRKFISISCFQNIKHVYVCENRIVGNH